MPELQPKFSYQEPKDQPEKGIEQEPVFEFLDFHEFSNLRGKSRGEILEYLKSADNIHGAKYKFMDFEEEENILKNPSIAPKEMKDHKRRRYYFFQPNLERRDTEMSYLVWDSKAEKFSRYIDVPKGPEWDPNMDSVVAVPK